MFSRIGFAALLACTLLFAGVAQASRLEPVYNVIDHPIPPAAQKLSLDEIGRNIILAGTPRHWRFEPIKPGQMRATYDNGKHAATINIAYSQRSYSITLVSTVNLLQEGNEVHRTYNMWVHNLEKDIDDRFQVAMLGAR